MLLLPTDARRTVAVAFIASRVDYCNGLLYGVSAAVIRRLGLQMVINAAARLVVGAGKFDYITPTLRDVLHWLPVRQRILYKVAATAFNCIHGTGPTYFRHFARRSPTSLVGRISVQPNAATCWSLVSELNSVDGTSNLQHQPFGTLCRHTYTRH